MSERAIATTENVNRDNWRLHEDGLFVATSARVLANNMSEAYNQLGEDSEPSDKSLQAREKMRDFHESLGLRIDNAFVMKPQNNYSEDLGVVDVDSVFETGQGGVDATVSEDRADFLYTYNKNAILECRPADCPVLTIKGTDANGQDVLSLLHVGWQGLNAGYLEQAFEKLDEMQVSSDSLRIQMSGAGYADNFHYKNVEHPLDDSSRDGDKSKRFTHPDRLSLFVNVMDSGEVDQEGRTVWSFDMDMPGFIRTKLKDLGVSDYQLYEEGSDTASLNTGYSSHSRDAKDKTRNTRDVVIATMDNPDQARITARYARLGGSMAIAAARTL